MGSEAGGGAAAIDLLRSAAPFLPDADLLLTPGTGLVLVDLVNGFCTVGAGNLVDRPLRDLGGPVGWMHATMPKELEFCCLLYDGDASEWARYPLAAFSYLASWLFCSFLVTHFSLFLSF
uniref:Uncharacterized protein n=1 Tax=Triticum urartu TaxID=4572 RepID=A0A8R7URT5_TRIUA